MIYFQENSNDKEYVTKILIKRIAEKFLCSIMCFYPMISAIGKIARMEKSVLKFLSFTLKLIGNLLNLQNLHFLFINFDYSIILQFMILKCMYIKLKN